MALRRHTFNIKGVEFETRALPFSISLPLLNWLRRAAVPAIEKVTTDGEGGLDAVSMAKAMAAFFQGIDAKDEERLIRAFAEATSYRDDSGRVIMLKDVLELWAAANWGSIVILVKECAMFNFADFFQEALRQIQAIGEGDGSGSPAKSTGLSGE